VAPEDGLADLTDGLGGSMKREKALEIMKDSRIGSFGTLSLIIALGGKISLLTLLGQQDIILACLALFGAHISSRFTPLFLIRFQSHVGDEAGSKSKPLSDAISWSTFSIGTIWWLASLILLHFLYPAVPWWGAMVGAAITLIWMLRLLARRLGGFTGDGLGATQQICEIGFLPWLYYWFCTHESYGSLGMQNLLVKKRTMFMEKLDVSADQYLY
jgi:Cobalamin-5-phosphate synthase